MEERKEVVKVLSKATNLFVFVTPNECFHYAGHPPLETQEQHFFLTERIEQIISIEEQNTTLRQCTDCFMKLLKFYV